MVAKQAGQVAGGFAGGFFNNPGVIAGIGIIAAIGIPLLIFRKEITEFFGRSFGEAAVEGAGAAIGGAFESAGESVTNFFSNITLPEITLPSLPSIELPSLPSFELPSIELPPIGDVDFTEVGMAAARARQDDDDVIGQPVDPEIIERQVFGDVTIAPTLLDSIIVPFTGGGPSFEGGTIFETPIEFLSLNQIIEMGLAESASEAASLRAEAIGFDGGFIPEGFFEQEQQGLPEGIVAPDFGGLTGDPAFIGLTPEEIALRLTGGNISNF